MQNRYKFKWLDTDGNWGYRTLNYSPEAGYYLSNKQPSGLNLPDTFCQCTGEADANGTDIYEGDRVYVDKLDCVVTIAWLDGGWCLKFNDGCISFFDLYDLSNECVVVGNIHDKEALL